MSVLRSVRQILPQLSYASFLLGLALCAGCTSGYPEDLAYPTRTDPIVGEQPKSFPTRMDTPGDMNSTAVEFKEQKGTLYELIDAKTKAPKNAALAAKAASVKEIIDKMFGTPAHPDVTSEGIAPSSAPTTPATKDFMDEAKSKLAEQRKALQLDKETLARGSELYRKQCLHCHGLTGDGRGPTGPWVNPHPRDYRKGKFKFTSSTLDPGRRKARRDDLLRVLKEGIDGTSMPSFGQLPEKQLHQLASYVIHLSVRGEIEARLLQDLAARTEQTMNNETEVEYNGETLEKLKPAEYAVILLGDLLGHWLMTDKEKLEVPAYKLPADKTKHEESIRKGYALFSKDAACLGCHEDFGRKRTYRWDDWAGVTRPANLTEGVYRGGRSTHDLFHRVHSGLNGTAMPAASNDLKEKPELIWNIVDFVQALPYPNMLPEDIRDQVYPKKK